MDLPAEKSTPLSQSPAMKLRQNYKSLDSKGRSISEAGASDDELIEGSDYSSLEERSSLARKSTLFSNFDADNDDDVAKYDDFHTIDWQRDNVRDRMRHRIIWKRKGESLRNFCRCMFDALSAWFCVSIVGILAGTFAGIIDMGTTWLTGLKEGICVRAFWFDRDGCCWSAPTDVNGTHHDYSQYPCDDWRTWPNLLGLDSADSSMSSSSYWLDYTMYVLIGLGFGMTSAFLVRSFAPYACGSGIPEIKTILSGFIIRGYLGKWTLVIKSIALMLAVASGLSLGKEGPLVHVACCIGNIISYIFPKYGKNEAKKREILSAASAAGVSVAFGAPVGGVLFSLEEVSYYFPLKTLWRSFFCALVAAFVLRSINPFGDQQAVMFYIEYNDPWYLFELIPFVGIGIFGGLWGALFIKANIYWCKIRRNSSLGKWPIMEVLVVVLITALLSYHIPYTRISGAKLITLLFSECKNVDGESNPLCDGVFDQDKHAGSAGPLLLRSLWQLGLALLFKCIITVFTFGIKTPSGLFIPTMAVGAIVGRLVGIGMNELVYAYPDLRVIKAACGNLEEDAPCITPGVYALIGAAAALGGVTRMTISLVVIMFELTGGLTYVMPIMFACVTAKWVGDAFGNRGIYDAHIELNEYPYLDNKTSIAQTTLSGQVMRPKPGSNDPPLIVIKQEGMTVRDVKNILTTFAYNGFPVVVSEESQYLVGLVARKDLASAILNADRNILDSNPDDALVYFTDGIPNIEENARGPTLRLRRILDLAPITITDQTPMETVKDMFTKLGLRQILVTHNGRLLGVVTKKDVLNHFAEIRGVPVSETNFH